MPAGYMISREGGVTGGFSRKQEDPWEKSLASTGSPAIGDLGGEIWQEILEASQSTGPRLDSSTDESFRTFINPDALQHDMAATVPGFIKPIPKTISPAIQEFLLLNGALTLPSIPLQNALLQAFLEHVFPSTPVIEWQSVLATVADRRGGNGQLSLLLFHAIMLSATQYVGLEHLLRAGYQNRQEAYTIFARNANLLYESGYEANKMTTLQALLLMKQCSDTFGGAKEWYQKSNIISLARSIGIFEDKKDVPPSLNNWKLCRRVAWACYMMDCLSAFRARSMPLIDEAHFRIPMLSVNDFNLQRGSLNTHQAMSDCSFVQDVQAQRDMATLCVSFAQLCACIRGLLEVQGRPTRVSNFPEFPMPAVNATMNGSPGHRNKLRVTENALWLWKERLPPALQFVSCSYAYSTHTKSSIQIQKSHLHMVYFSAVAVLHQSGICASSATHTSNSAHQITQIALGLQGLRLEQRLPPTCITSILIAMIVLIRNTKRMDRAGRDEAIKDLQSCERIMAGLTEVYPDVRTATALASQALEQFASESYGH